jgi:hypothetical protein
MTPEKYQLFQKAVWYLGHIVSMEEVTMDLEKQTAVWEWPPLKDKHELRSFIGLCTYYQRFIAGRVILQSC